MIDVISRAQCQILCHSLITHVSSVQALGHIGIQRTHRLSYFLKFQIESEVSGFLEERQLPFSPLFFLGIYILITLRVQIEHDILV
jgi:hypothetical protein